VTFFYIAASVITTVLGQLGLKQGMNVIGRTPGGSVPIRMATSIWVVGGLAVYALGVVFWTLALSGSDLTYVYPFASLAYVGVVIGSYFAFKEPINRTRLIGLVVIIVGLIIISTSK
jgi:multidrug transporter EmrE-like cation transporter